MSFTLPEGLRRILIHFGAAIMFDKELKFKPNKRTMLEDDDGYLGLDILYGTAHDTNGLEEVNARYEDQFPSGLIVIGGCGGGDEVCLQKSTGRIVFWHHEAFTVEESLFEIANDFDDFMNRIEVMDESPGRMPDGIIKEKSFLDF